jgi:glycosyltransferase
MTGYPKVSIITPTLNCAATIDDCLQSVASQGYDNIEHIIIDGGSSDGTQDLARRFGTNVISEPDTGIYDAINKGLAQATGEIIHILNADDWYRHEGVISRVVEFMGEKSLDVCHARVELVDRNKSVTKVIGFDISRGQLLRKCKVAHPAVFVRRSVYERYGGFSTGFRIAGDHEFMLRIWDKVKIGFLPEVTTRMRLGGASTRQVSRSYRESMAAALLHGQNPTLAVLNYYYELLKSRLYRPLLKD